MECFNALLHRARTAVISARQEANRSTEQLDTVLARTLWHIIRDTNVSLADTQWDNFFECVRDGIQSDDTFRAILEQLDSYMQCELEKHALEKLWLRCIAVVIACTNLISYGVFYRPKAKEYDHILQVLKGVGVTIVITIEDGFQFFDSNHRVCQNSKYEHIRAQCSRTLSFQEQSLVRKNFCRLVRLRELCDGISMLLILASVVPTVFIWCELKEILYPELYNYYTLKNVLQKRLMHISELPMSIFCTCDINNAAWFKCIDKLCIHFLPVITAASFQK